MKISGISEIHEEMAASNRNSIIPQFEACKSQKKKTVKYSLLEQPPGNELLLLKHQATKKHEITSKINSK